MQKPNNYSSTQAASADGFSRLPAGNYVLKIMEVKDAQTKTGKPMTVISYDVAEGEHKDFYTTAYKADSRDPKKWGGVAYIVNEDKDGNCSRNFKGFTEALENSNPGYLIPWGDNAGPSMKGKLIGAQMRDEEYLTNKGEYRMSAKVAYWASVEDIRNGKCKELTPKYIDRSAESESTGFMSVPDSIDDELPFK